MTIIVPDILRTVHLSMLKHLMDWVTSFLKQHSSIDRFNQLWAMMPPYPGFAGFNKPYSQVTKSSGNQIQALGWVVMPVFSATRSNSSASQRIILTEALLCVTNLMYFHSMAQYRYHTDATIKYMENYVEEFHRHKDVFSQFRASKSTKKALESLKKQLTLDKQDKQESQPAWNYLAVAAKRNQFDEDKMQIESEIEQHHVEESNFNFGKMRLLNHFSDHILQLGNLIDASSELPGRVMMDLEQAYQQSNRNEAAFHILRTNAWREVFEYSALNANAVKQCRDDVMPLTKVPIMWMIKNVWPESKTLDDLAEWGAMPKGELHNHITSCFKRFPNLTDYVNHDQYLSCLNDAKCMWYNAVAIPVTSFPCNEQAVHMVCCTGSTRWRNNKPPRNGTVLLWMGTSLDSHFKSGAGLMPTRLNYLFVVEDPDPALKGVLPGFHQQRTFPSGRNGSVRVDVLRQAIRDTPVADYSAPGANTTHRVP